MTTITGNTQLFAILADPIHHVKTPQGINSHFAAEGFDGVLVPIHVRAAQLQTAVAGLRAMENLRGMVITVPHKTAMLALCDAVSGDARQIGAVNVVHRTAEGQLIGDMLDGEGFVAGLRQQGIEPAGQHVYLAGAGGAASAIAFALARAGVRRLSIYNRTAAKAQALIERIQAVAPQVDMQIAGDDPAEADLVVNGTSLGLREGDALPLDAARLQPHQVVAEVIMQPVHTPLLLAAQARGCRIHPGAPMLACQIPLMAAFMRHGRTDGAP